jgi:MFS family permease
MPGRWHVLALLFTLRTTMAFQFQAVGALGPLVRTEFGVELIDLGLLIGLYQSAGIVISLPSGALGRRFGDKACVLAGLVLMTLGGLTMGLLPGWSAQIGGRLLAGFGGVLLTVMMTKIVADWFSGREIATAMGIYVNSWPFGIAIALMAMPVVGAAIGVRGAYLLTAGITALGALLLIAFYRAPAPATPAPIGSSVPTGRALAAVILAGLVWGLFNAAISMVFSFGNSMLVARGWSLTAAGGATSLALWLIVLSVPLGGVIADRSGRPGSVLVGGCLVFALLLCIAARTELVLPIFAALGLICGLPGGVIMSLPARVLSPQTRAVGMGLFWTILYVINVAAPLLAGYLAGVTGTAGTAFDLGAAGLVLACAVFAVFTLVSGPEPKTALALRAPPPLSPAKSAEGGRP